MSVNTDDKVWDAMRGDVIRRALVQVRADVTWRVLIQMQEVRYKIYLEI